MMIAPATKVHSEKAFSRGKATSRAPICSGMMMLKNAAPSGITARKIIVVPCIVNMVLYCCAVSTVLFGTINCSRIIRASLPPTSRKASANRP